MTSKPTTRGRSKKRYAELVGVDFSTTATKVVRLKKGRNELSLVGMDLLPAVSFTEPAAKVEIPRNLVTNYGCVAYSALSSVVRMVNAPLPADEEKLPLEELRKMLNVEGDFRVSSKLVKRGSGRSESSFLAAAIPDSDVRFVLDSFPSGSPAPASVEIAGLSFIPAFLNARSVEAEKDSICLLETGESVSHFVFLNKGVIGLVGKLSFGVRSIREKLAEDLGVDDELAGSILHDRSINISSSLRSVMEPYLKQLTISMDFLARHQGSRVSRLYASGGLCLVPSWAEEVESMMNLKVVKWSPLENIHYDAGQIGAEMEAQATRFSAAIGAAIGGFEEL